MGCSTRLRYDAALAAWAACFLLLLGPCAAQSFTRQILKSPTGESVQLLGDSVALKYFPAASANCSQCFLSFKLGALSELDAFGQPVVAHTIPDLSNLVPEVTGGQRVSGSVSYHYVTMTFTAARLPPGLSKNNCPSLESIINQAYAAGVGQDNDLMGQFAGQAAAAHRGSGPANLVGQTTAPELAQMSPFGRKLTQFGWLPSIKVVSSRDLSPPPSPPSPTSTPPASPAAQPAQPSAGADASKPAASQSPSDKSAEKPAEKPTEKPAEKPADKPAEKPADKPAEKPADKPEDKQGDKPAEKPADKPADTQEGKQEDKQAAPAPAPAADSKQEATDASPAPQQVAIEPPTTNQIVGPQRKPVDPPAAEAKPKPEDKAPPPAPAPVPEPAKQSDQGSGLIPTPAEKEDGSEKPVEPTPAAPPPAPTPAPQPQPQPAPAALTPLVPASQAADLWHQQLAANNGYLPNPAGAAGQAWGAYGGSQYPTVGGYPAGMFGDAPPQIKVTFMFGFSGNKTFAYGRGRVVSAPAGSIKYTVEAQNWPFCSLYNSLKLEVVMASTMKDAQPQFVLSDASDVFEDMDSMRGPATRKLHQSEAFTDFMEADRSLGKKGVAGMGGLDMLGLGAAPIKKVATGKLLVGPNLAAATEFPTYAFSSDRFTSESNVSVALATSKDAARFSLTFKYFEQGLYYDPTVFFTNKDDMMLADTGGVLPSAPTTSLMCKNETDCVRGRRRPSLVANSSSRPGGSLQLQVLLSAAAVLLVALVL